MRLAAFRRTRPDIDESTRQLAAALYAGGERADDAVAFLMKRMAERFRRGGDDAIELFLDWMDILTEGNEETAAKFYASVIPMLPAETRKKFYGSSSSHSALIEEDFDPVVQSLISKIAIGGKGGAEAVTTFFNALEETKGASEAYATTGELLRQISPALRSSIKAFLPDRIKAGLADSREGEA
jgi:hypothetical protein